MQSQQQARKSKTKEKKIAEGEGKEAGKKEGRKEGRIEMGGGGNNSAEESEREKTKKRRQKGRERERERESVCAERAGLSEFDDSIDRSNRLSPLNISRCMVQIESIHSVRYDIPCPIPRATPIAGGSEPLIHRIGDGGEGGNPHRGSHVAQLHVHTTREHLRTEEIQAHRKEACQQIALAHSPAHTSKSFACALTELPVDGETRNQYVNVITPVKAAW